jgi:hypothetical protein
MSTAALPLSRNGQLGRTDRTVADVVDTRGNRTSCGSRRERAHYLVAFAGLEQRIAVRLHDALDALDALDDHGGADMWSISTRRGLIDDAANPTMRLSVEDVAHIAAQAAQQGRPA